MNIWRGAAPIIREPIVSDFAYDVWLFVRMIKKVVFRIDVWQSACMTQFVGQKESVAAD